MSHWQKIDSAPKQTQILLYLAEPQPFHDNQQISVGEVLYQNFSGTEWFVRLNAISAHDSTWHLSDFSHWMPLPAPPSPEGGKE